MLARHAFGHDGKDAEEDKSHIERKAMTEEQYFEATGARPRRKSPQPEKKGLVYGIGAVVVIVVVPSLIIALLVCIVKGVVCFAHH